MSPVKRPQNGKTEPAELSEYQSYYAVIRKIPRGRVMTYGEVAFLAGRPTSARRVGYSLFSVMDPRVPWWRVINARGEISARRNSGYLGNPEETQRVLLEREGVVFDADGRIELERYLYRPPAKKPSARRKSEGADAR